MRLLGMLWTVALDAPAVSDEPFCFFLVRASPRVTKMKYILCLGPWLARVIGRKVCFCLSMIVASMRPHSLGLVGLEGGILMRRFAAGLAVVPVLFLAACVASTGGGGGSPPGPPERVGLFSHASYEFGLLNTTLSGGAAPDEAANRTLGLIYLQDAEVRARLPHGSVDYRVNYTLVGGANDLRLAFFTLNTTDAPNKGARLLYQVAPRYARRAYALNYVVNTLGVRSLRVEAQIVYLNASDGYHSHEMVSVPVNIRAFATAPAANDLLVFEGTSRTGTEQRTRMVTTTVPDQSFRGRLSQTINLTQATGAERALGAFTARWTGEHYTPDPAEVRRADVTTDFDGTQLITSTAPRSTVPALAVRVTLTLNNNSATQVADTYMIPAGTNISEVNNVSDDDASFLAFVQRLNTTTTGRRFNFVALDAQDRVGPNVTEMAWSFSYPYRVNVTSTRTQTDTLSVRRLSYGTTGLVNENVAGRTCVLGLCSGERLPGSLAADVPNVFSSFADALGSASPVLGSAPSALGATPGALLDAARKGRAADLFDTIGLRMRQPRGLVAGEEYMPTLYLRVRNVNSSERAYRCDDAYYYDNQVRRIQVRAAADASMEVVDHEAQSLYGCRLEASLDGLAYAAVTTDLLTDALEQIDRVEGFVAEGSVNASQCGSANQTTRVRALRAGGCVYQAGLMIGVGDVNEPVEFNVAGVLAAVNETYVGAANNTRPAVGTPFNTRAADPVLATLTYREPDENATGARLSIGVPRIVRVVPAQVVPSGRAVATAPLFYLAPRAADQAALMLNASVAADVLDYEALTTNATGQRGLRITLQATDNSTARLITERVFNLEVRDVVYAPVDFVYVPRVLNHTEGPPVEQRLLPGLAQFVSNGGPVLGRMQAVDPETNTSAGLAYAYVGVEPSNPVQNRSLALGQGLGRPTADELLLVGPGLRDGDRFNVRLRAMQPAAPNRAIAELEVVTVVNYAALATNATPAYIGAPPAQFVESELQGSVGEGRAGGEVQYVAGTHLNQITSAADVQPRFRYVDNVEAELGPTVAALVRAYPALRRPDHAAFTLNATSGQLRINEAADFTARADYTLLLAVANGTDQAYQRSDYAVVQVVITDNNTAPRLTNLRASPNLAAGNTVVINASAARVNFQIAENTAPGTTLATFDVVDDNPLMEAAFAPRRGGDTYRLERATTPQQIVLNGKRVYRATYQLVTARPDYEADAEAVLSHVFTDGGRYVYAGGQYASSGTDQRTVALDVNGTVTDINEPPRLAFVGGTRTAAGRLVLDEDAAQDASVVGVRAEDPEGLVANLSYTLTTAPASLAAVFNTSAAVPAISMNGRVATWALRVANPDALENAGDGAIFTLRLAATDVAGLGAAATLGLEVRDVVHAFDVTTANTTNINITEQQALDDANHVLRGNLLRLAAVQPDYDEFFFGTNVRVGDVEVRAGELSYADAAVAGGLHDEERFALLRLQPVGRNTASAADDAVHLVLDEARLIEQHLLGVQVTQMVRLTDPSGGVAAAEVAVPVDVVPPVPVGLAFGRADAADRAVPRVPAAYTVAYRQSAYVQPVAARACTAGSDQHIMLATECYPTELVADASGQRRAHIARDLSRQMHFGAARATLRNLDNQELGLSFTDISGVNFSIAAEDVQIYVLNAEGALQDGRASFDRFFTFRVNNSEVVGGRPQPVLWVQHKQYEVFNRTTGQPLVNRSYPALDTLAFQPGQANQILTYFVLAVDGGQANNASRRALAQLNIDVASVAARQARVAELQVLGDDLLDGETIGENEWARIVNNPLPELRLVVENPDGVSTNETVDVLVEVVASEMSDRSDGLFNGTAGNATGNQLVRLGANAADTFTFTLAAGTERSARQNIPFALARNVYGRALLRVNLTERDATGALVPDGSQARYFELVVEDRPTGDLVVDALTVGGSASGVDEDTAVLTTDPADPTDLLILRFLVRGTGFAPPRQQILQDVTITATNVTGIEHLRVRPGTVADLGDGSDASTKVVRQVLDYTEHGFGTTRFAIRAVTQEERGFADVARAYDAVLDLPPRTFMIRSVADPLRALPMMRMAARYRLPQFVARAGQQGFTATARSPAVVFFEDADLVTGALAAYQQPGNVQVVLPGPSQTVGGVSIQLTETNTNLNDIRPQVTRVPGTNQLRVDLAAISLTLIQAQREAIEQTGQVNLAFTVRLTDPQAEQNDPARTVAAEAQLNIRLMTADTVATPANYGTTPVALAEGTMSGAALFATNLTLTDPDLAQPTGEIYTYTLDVQRAGTPVFDLLAWNNGTALDGRTWQEAASSSAGSINRSLVLAKTVDDADVGVYAVRWTVRELSGGGDSDDRLVADGTFDLNITNVEEPTTQFCDVRNPTRVLDPSDPMSLTCASYLQDGAADLQVRFGPWYAPRVNELVDMEANVAVVYADPDLLALGDAALPQPVVVRVTGSPTLIEGDVIASARGEETRSVAAAALGLSATAARIDATDRFALMVGLRLNLTAADYAFINRHERASLIFDLALTPAAGTPPAAARAKLLLRAPTVNEPRFAAVQQYNNTSVAFDEGTPANTALFPDLNITDPDVRRTGGDTFSYTVTGAPAGLVEWSEGASETVQSTTSPLFMRTLRLARAPDDADVGRHVVDWTITNDGFVTRGQFRLNITNVAEPPVVECDVRRAADDCGYRGGAFVLQDHFGTWEAPRVGLYQDTGESIRVVFRHPDLLLTAQDLLPQPANVSISNVTLAGGGIMRTLTADAAFNLTDTVQVTRMGQSALFSVTLHVHLNFTLADYALINQQQEANLSFQLNVTTDDGFAAAGVQLNLRADDNNPRIVVPAAYRINVSFMEGVSAGTALAAPIQLEDPDVMRVGGDRYHYFVTVTRGDQSAVLDLVTWSHNRSETVQQADNRRFERALVFNREPDDADVGNYTVIWSIRDMHHARASDSLMAANGLFNLSIINVADPPLVDCDGTRADEDCGYNISYADGDAIVLQDVFGNWTHPVVDTLRVTNASARIVLLAPDALLFGPGARPTGTATLGVTNASLIAGTTSLALAPTRVQPTNVSSPIALLADDLRFAVQTAPLALGLTREQYDFINQRVDARLNMTLNITTSGGSALAQAQLALHARNNPPLIVCPGGAFVLTLAPCTGTALASEQVFFPGRGLLGGTAGTRVGGVLPIQDPDTTRATGDRYIYTVVVTANATIVPDLLRWSNGSQEIVRHPDRGSYNRSNIAEGSIVFRELASFTRNLELARAIDDPDIGNYTVNWTIANSNADGTEARLVTRGHFRLAIPNRADPPLVICDAESADAAGCGYRPVRFELNQIFHAGNIGTASFVNLSAQIAVVFAEPDLLAPGPDRAALPTVASFSFANGSQDIGQDNDGTPQRIDLEVRLNLTDGIAVRRQQPDGTTFTVELPLFLRLTRSEYQALNNGDGQTLGVDLILADSPGGATPARARIELIVEVTNTNAHFNHTAAYNGTIIQVAEETPANTSIVTGAGRFINITDADVLRPNGDDFIYRLTVRHASSGVAAPDLLAWDANGTRRPDPDQAGTIQWEENVRQSVIGLFGQEGQPWFQRAIILAKQPQDEDVGNYTVAWSIRDDKHERTSTQPPVQGTFQLSIINVNDAIQACGRTESRNCTDVNLTAQTTLYDLVGDFNATGELHTDPVRRNVTVYFTDRDFRAPPIADLALPAPNQIKARALNADLHTQLNLTFGEAQLQRLSDSTDMEVLLPLFMQLNATQYEALDQAGGTLNIQLHITAMDAGDTEVRAIASVNFTLLISNDAAITAGPYADGHLVEYRERLYPYSAVFITPDPTDTIDLNVSLRIQDPDIRGAGGDTYHYSLNVTRMHAGRNISVPDLLAWSHGGRETLKNQPTDLFERNIYFVRGPDSADVGSYTVTWNITEERAASQTANAQHTVARGQFTMNIRETPRVSSTDVLPPGQEAINTVEGTDPLSAAPPDWEVSIRGILGEVTVTLDYDRRLDFEDARGAFLRLNGEPTLSIPWTTTRRNEPARNLVVNLNLAYPPTDRQVTSSSRYEAIITTSGGNFETRRHPIIVSNINDPTNVSARGVLTGTIPGQQITLPSFALQDEDFRVRTRADTIRSAGQLALRSTLRLVFGEQDGACTFLSEERLFPGVLNDHIFTVNTPPVIDLLANSDCATIFYNASRDRLIDANLFNDNLELTEVRLVNYRDPSGGPEITTGDLLLASGQLNIPLDADVDGDGVDNTADNCPRIANGDQLDSNGNDFGDVCEPDDADFDGIDDSIDNCFFTANPDQTDTDGDGYGDSCSADGNNNGFRDLSTIQQLEGVRTNLNVNFELLRDISLAGRNWQPIGGEFNAFTGIFDGRGHTISNLSIRRTGNLEGSGRFLGLFSSVQAATIRNTTLRIQEIRLSNVTSISLFIGGLIGSVFTASSVQDNAVILEGDILVDSRASVPGTGNIFIGGLIGSASPFPAGGDISRSYVLSTGGKIIGNSTRVNTILTGGLIGSHRRINIMNSYVLLPDGASIGAFGPDAQAGGLAGSSFAGISNSYAIVNGSIEGTTRGGLVGNLGSGGSLSNSYFSGPLQNAHSGGGANLRRTVPQLACPETPGATCSGATTYTSWDNTTVWDFGDDQTLPDLRSQSRPPEFEDLLLNLLP